MSNPTYVLCFTKTEEWEMLFGARQSQENRIQCHWVIILMLTRFIRVKEVQISWMVMGLLEICGTEQNSPDKPTFPFPPHAHCIFLCNGLCLLYNFFRKFA